MKYRLILFLMLTGLSFNSFGQFFYYGQEPASLKWKTFDTPHFKMVFTEDASLQAYYYARLLEKNYRYFSVKEDVYPQHTTVLIHNRDVLPNGFSVPAPVRMEISSLPSQSVTSQNWLQLLSLHEFQHSMQIAVFKKGFARHLSWVLGDVAIAGAMVRLPFWFIEGEAVYTETAYTFGGRGRDSDFLMQWKALADSENDITYDKAINGSYKDFIPDHYKLGYLMYAHGIRKYPDTLWQYVRKRTADRPYAFRPFSSALKAVSGKNVEGFFKETLNSKGLSSDEDSSQPLSGNLLIENETDYVNYKHVKASGDGSYFALKQSLGDIEAFVRIREGKEEIIYYPGNVFDEQLSYSGNSIFWTEYYTHPRWTRKNYSVVKSYDVVEEKEVVITPENERHFSPDVNENNKIVTVKLSVDGTPSLVIASLSDYSVLKERKFTRDVHIITPRWSEDGDEVVFIEITDRGKAIKTYTPDEGRMTEIFEATVLDISHPVLTSEYLFFTAPIRGRDELYAMKRKTRQLFRVADARFDLGFPYTSQGSAMTFSRYTENGYRPYMLKLNDSNWEAVSFPASDPFTVAADIAQKELDFNRLPEMSHQVEPVKSGKHLFNFHSLTPFGYSKEDMVKGPGVAVHSQNIFSTMFTSAGYFYDYDEDGGTYFADVEYRGWYPVLKFSTSFGKRDGWLSYQDERIFTEWNRYRVSGGVEIPHRFNSGKMRRFMSGGVSLSHRVNDISHPDTLSFTFETVQTIDYNFYFQNVRRKSHRDLYPRYGQVVDLNFLHTPFNFSDVGYVAATEGVLYLPGIFANQHIWIYGGYQYQSKLAQPLTGFVSYPRGTHRLHHRNMFSAKVNYALPLAYPDWNIGPLAYFKRIRALAFVDYAYVSAPRFDDGALTTGLELTADTHLLRLVTPAEFGVRSIFDVGEETLLFEFLFSMNFNIY